MKLFVIEDGIVKPTREVLAIPVFSHIWNRDTTRTKSVASREIAFIEFYCSLQETNPYSGYVNDEERFNKIKEGLFKDEPDWQPDEGLIAAVNLFIEFRDEASPTMKMYKSAIEAMENLQNYLKTVNFEAKTKTGMLVNKPSDVINALIKLSALMTSFQDLKKKIQQETLDSTRTRGNRVINHFER